MRTARMLLMGTLMHAKHLSRSPFEIAIARANCLVSSKVTPGELSGT